MIDFSEPECSNCFHCRTSGILNSQESEPSNVISSSVPSMPVSSGPVQALGPGSASVGSTSTSSPVQSSSPFSFGFAPAATTSVSSGPAQSLDPTIFSYGAFGAPSQRPAFQVTVGSGASATSTSSTSSPVHSSSPLRFGSAPAVTSVSSVPTQALGPTTPPRLGSMEAPVQATFGSGACSISTSFSFLPFGCVPAPPPSGSSLFGPAKDMPWAINSFSTGCGIEWVRPDVGVLPASSSSTTTVVFGTTPVSVSSLFGPAQDFPKTTSVCASSTPVPTRCGIALARSGFGSSPASSSSNLFGPNRSTTASVFGTSAASVSSLFQPAQHPLRSGVHKLTSVCVSSTPKNPLSSIFPAFGVDYLPGSSSNPFGPNPSSPSFGGGSVLAGVKISSPQPFGFNATTTLLPSSSSSSSATFSSNPNIGSQLFASHDWSRHTEQGSRYPGYAPTPDGQRGDMYISTSASNSYLYKSHDELRWEDYNQGVKGGSFPAAHVTPIGSRPNAVLSPSTASPSIFASPSIPDHLQRTHFGTTQGSFTGSVFGVFPAAAAGVTTSSSSGFGQTNAVFSFVPSSSTSSSTTFPPISSSVQRPHETTAVSSPASGCTACGASSSPSASGYFTFNGATTPPSAATSHPGLFFPTSGSGPMMFGTTLQGTTPPLQAYPVQGFILFPFAAMSLQ